MQPAAAAAVAPTSSFVNMIRRRLASLLKKKGRRGSGWRYWLLVLICCIMSSGGLLGGMLMGRLYYNRGGTKIWLYTLMQSVRWPVLPALFAAYWREWTKQNPGVPFGGWRQLPRLRAAGGSPASLTLLLILAGIGLLFAIDNFLFALGVSYLPVSTSALLTSSQQAFNAVFAYFIVRHRFTAAPLNAVFLISLSSVLLGLRAADASTERPPGITHSKYVLGFAAAIGAAAVFGLASPLFELTCQKVSRKSTFCVVIEAQVVMAIFATLFTLGGMAVNHEYPALPREASSTFDGAGPAVYTLVLVATAVLWQFFFLGITGLIFLVSSVFSIVVTAATFPVIALVAIPAFGDSGNALKIIAMVLAVWGIISYVYGGYESGPDDTDVVARDGRTTAGKRRMRETQWNKMSVTCQCYI